MLDCKEMATPMVSNLNFLQDTCGCYFIQAYGGFIDELDKHKTGYMFCCEHPKSIYRASRVGSFDHRKTCDEVS
jgi:hypothetical protein